MTLPNGQVLLAGGIENGICFLGAAAPTLVTATALYNPATNTFAAGTASRSRSPASSAPAGSRRARASS